MSDNKQTIVTARERMGAPRCLDRSVVDKSMATLVRVAGKKSAASGEDAGGVNCRTLYPCTRECRAGKVQRITFERCSCKRCEWALKPFHFVAQVSARDGIDDRGAL